MQLRLTTRAMEDLELDLAECARLSANQILERHGHIVLRAFVEQRGQNPEGPESTQLPRSNVIVYNLHAGRYRGLTWHDRNAGVVWLLGVGYHRSGDPSDAYAVLKGRDQRGELLPDERDYFNLEPEPAETLDFLEAVANEAPALYEHAADRPGTERRAIIGNILEVSVKLEEAGADSRLWIGIAQPPRVPGVLPPEWLTVLLAGLLPPEAQFEDLDWSQTTFPRSGEPPEGEWEQVCSWTRPS